MYINFSNVDRMSNEQSVNVRDTTTKNMSSVTATDRGSNISLDISSEVTDNTAYKAHGRTIKDVMKNAASIDVEAQRNYLTVMSNCVSASDLQKMYEDGFDPRDIKAEDVVSIVDHIKAALLKGGTQVYGYTDTISDETLSEITGSQAYAGILREQALAADISLDESNASEIKKAYDVLSRIDALTDAGIKYLIENGLELNTENLYRTTYSAGHDAMAQGHGYYQAGEGSAYLAKKPEELSVEALLPQLEEIISEAGYEISESNVEAATWLIRRGIPLTSATYGEYQNIQALSLPMSFEEFAGHAIRGLVDGISPMKASLVGSSSLRRQAYDINHEVESLGTIKGRRVLEEVRLSMTTEANLKLLRSGFSIDTAPMEELVRNLKEIEKEFAINLAEDENEIEAVRQKDIFNTTVELTEVIRYAPISISWSYEKIDTLSVVGQTAAELKRTYDEASRSYESLMTAPRRDLGDSIREAFRNVDDILKEMELPLTEENRRAVRILGYNSLEINEDSLRSVKEKDMLLHEVIEELTPGRVLSMIRAKVNPLEMSIEELKNYLDAQDRTKEDIHSYSRFLYQLEQNKGITEEEREAYIGIFRLINQIKKGDYSSVGAVEKLGVELSFNNLLTGLRSRKHGAMDYRVDDSFGGIDAVNRGIESITSQIARGYITDTADLKTLLNEVINKEQTMEYEKAMREEINHAAKAEEDVIQTLINMDTPVSVNNILGMEWMLDRSNSIFNRLRELGIKKEAKLKLESKEEAQESFDRFADEVKEEIEDIITNPTSEQLYLRAMDIRELSKTYDLMDLLKRQANEENYEIPANINGELTAINLRVIHHSKEARLAISFETQAYGQVASEFVYEEGLAGYIRCSKSLKDELDIGRIASALEKEGLGLKECRILTDENVNLREFDSRLTSKRESDSNVISTNSLYRAAKVIIGCIERRD